MVSYNRCALNGQIYLIAFSGAPVLVACANIFILLQETIAVATEVKSALWRSEFARPIELMPDDNK